MMISNDGRGFTLIEIMIGLGILAVSSAVVTGLYFRNSRDLGKSDGVATFSQLVSKMGMALDHPVSCQRMMAGKTVDLTPMVSPSPSGAPIEVSPLALENEVVADPAVLLPNGLTVRSVAVDRVLHDLGLQPSGNRGYLVGLSLRVGRPAGPALEARFVVPLFLDPVTHAVQGCREP